jgi:hypothetical protein
LWNENTSREWKLEVGRQETIATYSLKLGIEGIGYLL